MRVDTCIAGSKFLLLAQAVHAVSMDIHKLSRKGNSNISKKYVAMQPTEIILLLFFGYDALQFLLILPELSSNQFVGIVRNMVYIFSDFKNYHFSFGLHVRSRAIYHTLGQTLSCCRYTDDLTDCSLDMHRTVDSSNDVRKLPLHSILQF